MTPKQISSFLSSNFWIILGSLSALPFLILTLYAHPLGLHDWDWSVMFTQEVAPGLSFFEQQNYFYQSTMGRFASTAVTSTLQYWFSPTNFKIFLVLFSLLFVWSVQFFIQSLFQHFLSKKQIWSIFGAIVCLYFAQLTSPYEAFYNISCVSTYNLAACATLIFGGLLLRQLQGDRSLIKDILLVSLGVFVVGSNEMTLIAVNWTLLLVVVGKRYYHAIWDKSLILSFILILAFSIVAVAAPGNYVRMGYETGSQSIIEALFYAVGLSGFNWLRWLSSTPLLLCVLLYVPLGLKITQAKEAQSFFNYPLLSGFGVLTLQPACLFILFYSAGITTFPERIMDLLFFLTLAGGIYCLQAILVQLTQRKIISDEFQLPQTVVVLAGSFIAFSLFFSGLNIDKSPAAKIETNKMKLIQIHANAGNAWLVILSGEANIYDQGMKKVYEEIKQCRDKNCVVSTPQAFPLFIYDKIYDRKALKGGFYIGEYFHPKQGMIVIYDSNGNR